MSHGILFWDACLLCPLQTLDLPGKNVEPTEISEHLERKNTESPPKERQSRIWGGLGGSHSSEPFTEKGRGPSVSGTSSLCPQSWALPCLQTLTLSTPVPGQLPAGTQKPALAGFTEVLANTMDEGTKRNVGTPATAPELSYTRNSDLQGSRAQPGVSGCSTHQPLLMPVFLPRFALPPLPVWNFMGSDQQTHSSSPAAAQNRSHHCCMLGECWYHC